MRINLENVTYLYHAGTPFATRALEEVFLSLGEGELTVVTGPSGSGKTTLVQVLNGLLRPQKGTVLADGVDVFGSRKALRQLRRRVALVFQYPEDQFFEENVLNEVGFALRKAGLDASETDRRVREALATVGLSDMSLLSRSPFSLSGGQKRRVALAIGLALHPEVLIADEPFAGLDPSGREIILRAFKEGVERRGISVLVVSHDLESLMDVANRVVLLHEGRVLLDGAPYSVLREAESMGFRGVRLPETVRLSRLLSRRDPDFRSCALTVEGIADDILAWSRRGRR